jgi:hypothetical protein
MFYAYIGAILLDSKSAETTYFMVSKIMDEYLNHNSTIDTYTEHPKVIILDEFSKRRHIFKKIKEK